VGGPRGIPGTAAKNCSRTDGDRACRPCAGPVGPAGDLMWHASAEHLAALAGLGRLDAEYIDGIGLKAESDLERISHCLGFERLRSSIEPVGTTQMVCCVRRGNASCVAAPTKRGDTGDSSPLPRRDRWGDDGASSPQHVRHCRGTLARAVPRPAGISTST
jgi:hypothetical protein